MGGFLALFDPISKIIERVLPDKAAQDAAKASLAQTMASGEFAQSLAETQGAVDIIKTEAQSQSWLARNVRPFLLLCWGTIITVNFAVPIVARLWVHDMQPLTLDPMVYKLAGAGFLGYVAARSWEKVKNSDT